MKWFYELDKADRHSVVILIASFILAIMVVMVMIKSQQNQEVFIEDFCVEVGYVKDSDGVLKARYDCSITQ